MKFVTEIWLIVLGMVVTDVAGGTKYILKDELMPKNVPEIDTSTGLTSDQCKMFHEGAIDGFIYGLSTEDTITKSNFFLRGTASNFEIWTAITDKFYYLGSVSAKFFRFYCNEHFGLASADDLTGRFYGGNPWAVANRAAAIGTYGVSVACAPSGKKLDVSRLCDNVNDCPEFEGSGMGADEKLCFHDNVAFTNDAGVAITSTGKFVHIRNLCNGVQDTEDNSDEDEIALLAVGLSCGGLRGFLKSPYLRVYFAAKKRMAEKK